MDRLTRISRRMALASVVLLLIGAACGPRDQSTAREAGAPQGDTVEESPSAEPRRSSEERTRAGDEGPRAPIVVETPFSGQEVASPMIVSGTANVFEATVSMELLDESGGVIVDKFTTATCGTGCRGDYSTRLRFDVDESQPATLQVFESSAEDGSQLHTVSIPVVLVP
jgi:hypothetical protein